jgi:DNA-binding XRE family transcriptional regulator
MKKHRFAKKFLQATMKEMIELNKRGIYQIMKKSKKPRISLT